MNNEQQCAGGSGYGNVAHSRGESTPIPALS
jgi:hypothetical protein